MRKMVDGSLLFMLCSNICDNDGARRTGWVVWRGRLYRIETCRAGTATPSGQWSPTAPALAGQDHKFRTGIEAEASRSEEHTSELQSLMRISYAVFCLKKKKNTQKH